MKLETETLDVLKNFAQINPSLMVRKGNILKTVSLTHSVVAKATLKQDFEGELAIYDLPTFLSALSMFSDVKLEFNDDRFVTLSNAEQTAMVNYYFADADMIVKPPEKEPDTSKTAIKFRLTKDTLNEMLKAASVLALPEVAIFSDGGKVTARAVNPKIEASNLFTKVIGESEIEYKLFYKVENMKLIANDYDVTVLPPKGKGGVGVAHFKAPNIEYWIAQEAHSTFN
jgi:hypothetical protein